MNQFSATTFLSLADRDVARYLAALPPGVTAEPNKNDLDVLITHVPRVSSLIATYILKWAIADGREGLERSVLEVMDRTEDLGGRYTLLIVLAQTRGLRLEHIESARRIIGESPTAFLAEGLRELDEAQKRVSRGK